MSEFDRRILSLILVCMMGMILLVAASCGNGAQGAGVSAQSFAGPNGTTCYVVYANGSAVGGNCQ